LAVTQVHRLSINPRNAGPASDLWASFFRHVGLALTSLNNEIRDDPDVYLANVFRSIHLIASTEVSRFIRACANYYLTISLPSFSYSTHPIGGLM
jgi:hypothetical protein